METLASYLTVNNIGEVCYRDFCDGMEHAYSFPSMEKHPNLDLYRPTKGALYTSPNTLSEKDETDVQRVLDKIAKETKEKMQRRLFLSKADLLIIIKYMYI